MHYFEEYISVILNFIIPRILDKMIDDKMFILTLFFLTSYLILPSQIIDLIALKIDCFRYIKAISNIKVKNEKIVRYYDFEFTTIF